jgi:hypothetical protein
MAGELSQFDSNRSSLVLRREEYLVDQIDVSHLSPTFVVSVEIIPT